MPAATSQTRLATAQQFVSHIGHHDFERSIELLSSDVTYRVAGTSALAGTFSGCGEVTRHLIDLVERTAGTFDALKWEDWMVGERHVAALVKIQVDAAARRYEGRVLFLVRFDVDDKIEEIVVFFEDERAAELVLRP